MQAEMRAQLVAEALNHGDLAARQAERFASSFQITAAQ